LRKPFSPSLIGFVLIIFNLKIFAIAGKRVLSYIRRADIADREERLKRLVYKDGIIIDKYREVKNMLGVSYNKKITREKSVRKETRYKRERDLFNVRGGR